MGRVNIRKQLYVVEPLTSLKFMCCFFPPPSSHLFLSAELPVSDLARYRLLPFKTSSAQRLKTSESSNR